MALAEQARVEEKTPLSSECTQYSTTKTYWEKLGVSLKGVLGIGQGVKGDRYIYVYIYILFRVSQNWGYHFGGPHKKDCNILGSIYGSYHIAPLKNGGYLS